MDIKELDKKQLILLTLLITFVVSIATGIVTVSLMNQMPKSVPQTINNVIQRTIEKVTTVQVPAPQTTDKSENTRLLFGNSDALVSIYLKDSNPITSTTNNNTINEVVDNNIPASIGQGVIISDIGLILVDSSILTEEQLYKVVLDKQDFNASILKKFSNGFTILKISSMTETKTENPDTKNTTDTAIKTQ